MLSNAQVALLAAAHIRQGVPEKFPYSASGVIEIAGNFLTWLDDKSPELPFLDGLDDG